MPKGSCDHTLEPSGFNSVTIVKGDGHVIVDVRWTWDGVSVWPDCEGPIFDMRVQNTDTVSWWAHWRRRRGGIRSREIPAGTDVTLTAQQLPNGLSTYQDIQNVTVTRSSDPTQAKTAT